MTLAIWAEVALAGVGTALASGYILDRKRVKVAQDSIDDIQGIVVPKSSHLYDPIESRQWLLRIKQFIRTSSESWLKGQVKFTWRIEKRKDGKVWFYLTTPEDRYAGVRNSIARSLEWFDNKPNENESEESAEQVPVIKAKARGKQKHEMWIGLTEQGLPIARAEGKRDPLITLLQMMQPGTAMEIEFSPASEKDFLKHIKNVHQRLEPNKNNGGNNFGILGEIGRDLADVGMDTLHDVGGAFAGRPTPNGSGQSRSQMQRRQQQQQMRQQQRDLLPHEESKVKAVRSRYAELGEAFEVKIKIIADESIYNATAALRSMTGAMMDFSAENRLVEQKVPKSFFLTASELANFVHVPSTKEWGQMPQIREHARTLRDDELNDGVAVGYLQHPVLTERLVKIPDGQFQRHFVLTGMTGSGKSSTAVFIAQSLIDRWAESKDKLAPGFTYFDPAEETLLIILSRLQEKMAPDDPRWSKIHYLSFMNGNYPVGMNLMEFMSEDGILSLLQRAYGGGAQMDRIIRNSVATLKQEPKAHHIVAGISPLLQNENWLNRILPQVRDNTLMQFWEKDYPALLKKPDAFQPIENRLSPFISGAQRLYFGQPNYGLPLRKWMDEGHIFLVDIKNLSNELIYLLAGSMIERYHFVAQQRPQSTSLTHYLIVDECHKVQVPIMGKIIAEDRKFGLSLGLITQSIEQFNSQLKTDIKENMGTVISLRQGPEGSGVMQTLTNGHFDAATLRALPDRVAAVYTRVKGETVSLETKAPFPVTYDRGKVVNFDDGAWTARRYDELRNLGETKQKEIGRPRKEVEDEFQYYIKYGKWPTKKAQGKQEETTAPPPTPDELVQVEAFDEHDVEEELPVISPTVDEDDDEAGIF